LIRYFLLLIIACVSIPVSAETSFPELSKQGTLLRLQGDFAAAAEIERRLIAEADTPIGQIFALNSIITHLTWDETLTQYDAVLEQHAETVFAWCQPLLKTQPDHVMANYYCGQTNFALSYFHALRGRYFQAGQHGTRSIDLLEAALAADPDFIDAKMHLGVGYYVADNLPPFIKMFSRVLWFIPTGNSAKSLPYLRDVVENGDEYRDVARYIYATLLMDEDEGRLEAKNHLYTLIDGYPANYRFQLRLISLHLMDDEFEQSLAVINRYLQTEPEEPEKSLAGIWKVRALLGLARLDEAIDLFRVVNPVFNEGQHDLPGWSAAWHLLTSGQIADVRLQREKARTIYKEILDLDRKTYINPKIADAAKAGLASPYQLN
jgi:tetratricopeptide (TPR) repeat protein